MSIWTTLGYHRPVNANWSYVAGYVQYKKSFVLVVTLFGEIV